MPEALSVFTVPCLLTSPCFGFRQNVPLLAKERDVAKRQGEVAIPSPCEGEGPEGEVKVPVAAWGYDAESVHSVFGDSEQVALAVRPCYRRQIFQVRRLPARGQLQLLR